MLRIAIASYKRHLIIGSKTLRFLNAQGYPPDKILIFVADEQEKKLYSDSICNNLYGEIIVGQLGLKEQRNFITDYMDDDEIYISIDDDVDGIKLMPGWTFMDLVRDATESIQSRRTGLYGVFPNDDGRRFQDRTTTYLSHILGAFFICRNHRDIRISYSEKEDYERSMLYFLRYGVIYRNGRGGVQTRYQKTPGGLQTTNRRPAAEEATQYLADRYPILCRRKDRKGFPDILLKYRARVE